MFINTREYSCLKAYVKYFVSNLWREFTSWAMTPDRHLASTIITVRPVAYCLSLSVDMAPLVYSNAHTSDPHIIQVLRAISNHQSLTAASEAVSPPTPPPTLAGAPLRHIISISDSDSEHEVNVAKISTKLHKIRVFVIPDDPADDSEYQEYLAEQAAEKAERAARRSAKKKKVKDGKRKTGASSYSDPEMDAFMAGIPLSEQDGMFFCIHSQ